MFCAFLVVRICACVGECVYEIDECVYIFLDKSREECTGKSTRTHRTTFTRGNGGVVDSLLLLPLFLTAQIAHEMVCVVV